MTVSLDLGEGVTRNTIFLLPFMKTIKASIMTKDNALVSGIMGEQFKLEMMVPQRGKEAPKTSEGLPVSLPVSIQRKQHKMNVRGSRNRTIELNKMVIHQCYIPGQH